MGPNLDRDNAVLIGTQFRKAKLVIIGTRKDRVGIIGKNVLMKRTRFRKGIRQL